MREIKFRAWEKILKVMLPVNEIYFYEGKVWMVKLPTQINRTDTSYIELMQFTGLLDKTGKEIYEGDILRLNYNYRERDDDDIAVMPITVQIDFQGGSFWFTGDGYTDCNWHFYNASDREVIGNIYQNKDLLL